jgi:mRNA interferase RelE/StbE
LAYNIKYTPAAVKQLSKLDKPVAKSILDYMKSIADNPTKFGKPLRKEYKGYWRHRVGDYRVISYIQDDILTVLVVRVGHRKDVYE